jgi:hypothetical protein
VVSLFRSILAVLGLCAAVAACAGLPETRESMLSSSGFKAMPVTTAAQVASFKNVPKNQFTRKVHNGKTVWVYPGDPTICTCLYVGDQAAYDVYLKKEIQKPPIVDSIQTNASGVGDWDFSPWVN